MDRNAMTMAKRCRAAIIGGLLAAAAAGPAAAEECSKLVASGNPEYAPYLWRGAKDEAHLVGAVASFMSELSTKIGIPIEVRYVGSWARVQEEMKNGRIDLIAGAFLTLERLDYMDYVYPPMALTRSVVFLPTDSKIKYGEWPDLKGRQGVTVIHNSFGQEFDAYATANLSITEVSKLENALRMVSNGRADYLIYEDMPGRAFAAKLGLADLKEASPPISNEALYLTISHQSACNTGALRGRIARAVLELSREGKMDGLIAAAIKEWQAQ